MTESVTGMGGPWEIEKSRRSGPAGTSHVSVCFLDPSSLGFPGRIAAEDKRHPSAGSTPPRTRLCSSQMLRNVCFVIIGSGKTRLIVQSQLEALSLCR